MLGRRQGARALCDGATGSESSSGGCCNTIQARSSSLPTEGAAGSGSELPSLSCCPCTSGGPRTPLPERSMLSRAGVCPEPLRALVISHARKGGRGTWYPSLIQPGLPSLWKGPHVCEHGDREHGPVGRGRGESGRAVERACSRPLPHPRSAAPGGPLGIPAVLPFSEHRRLES